MLVNVKYCADAIRLRWPRPARPLDRIGSSCRPGIFRNAPSVCVIRLNANGLLLSESRRIVADVASCFMERVTFCARRSSNSVSLAAGQKELFEANVDRYRILGVGTRHPEKRIRGIPEYQDPKFSSNKRLDALDNCPFRTGPCRSSVGIWLQAIPLQPASRRGRAGIVCKALGQTSGYVRAFDLEADGASPTMRAASSSFGFLSRTDRARICSDPHCRKRPEHFHLVRRINTLPISSFSTLLGIIPSLQLTAAALVVAAEASVRR